ncbi:MAG: L-aspartate oxidase, partial [Bacillota bacterium]
INYQQIRQELQTLMGQYVGPVRTESGLQKALDHFKQMDYVGRYAIDEEQAAEVLNMLLVGQLVAQAALLRTESRGGHYRQDYPQPQDIWRKHIILRRC